MTTHTQMNPSKIREYWRQKPATVDSMLGGLESVNSVDCAQSNRLLRDYFGEIITSGPPTDNAQRTAIDIGAGIGRVTKHVLSRFFHQIDLLETEKHFLDKSPDYIGADVYKKQIRKLYNCSMVDWRPDPDHKYDVMWLQWAIAYLADGQFIEFLNRCKLTLKPDGIMIIKDNATSHGKCDDDSIDFSTTRPLWLIERLINSSSFTIVHRRKQTKFPKGLYPVYMFVLK